jgi:hypothetical protein
MAPDTLTQSPAAPVGVWQVVADYATSFRTVDSGPDDPELVCRPDDFLDDNTKALFIRLDEKAEKVEGPLGFGEPTRTVLQPAEPFGALKSASAGDVSKWSEYAFVVRRVFDVNNVPIGLFVDIQSRPLKDILKLVFWEEQYSTHFMNYG